MNKDLVDVKVTFGEDANSKASFKMIRFMLPGSQFLKKMKQLRKHKAFEDCEVVTVRQWTLNKEKK